MWGSGWGTLSVPVCVIFCSVGVALVMLMVLHVREGGVAWVLGQVGTVVGGLPPPLPLPLPLPPPLPLPLPLPLDQVRTLQMLIACQGLPALVRLLRPTEPRASAVLGDPPRDMAGDAARDAAADSPGDRELSLLAIESIEAVLALPLS